MSVLFGKWNFEGLTPAPDYIAQVSESLAPYGPDSDGSYSKGGINILYHAFHTTKESRRETQPHIAATGAVLTWDGRLDNRDELIRGLGSSVSVTSTDVEIVAAAHEKWDIESFAKLIGDWALSIWNPLDRCVILAKDPIGTRHLYYMMEKDQVTWSTVLDPLVLFAGKTFALNEEYIAGWFSMFPAVHLTPFVGIHSVPPSSYVLLQSGKSTTRRYWDFDPDRRIRYPTDAEYEEHFRTIFGEAVRRRLRSDCPVLAELSGGRDSSSIVCVADAILTRGTAETPRLDTISYYDDSEPNWNERPYFTKVEEQRGRTGWHINIGSKKAEEQCKSGPLSRSRNNLFMSTPGHGAQPSQQFQMCLASQGNRVMLSGTGGDETMGGVPTPTPELQDTLARAQFRALAHQLKAWALEKRKPWFHLLFEAARGFFPPTIVGVTKARRPASWLQSNFAKHHWLALTGYPSRVKLFSASPVFQENVSTLDTLRRQLACKALPLDPLYEKRYPYLDRGLLEFTFAIPREQLVRPTQRRSLMRRALVGTVPNGILDRKRKAFAVRTPMLAISRDWVNLVEATQHMVSAALGIVDPERISDVLEQARRGREVHMVQLMRTIYSESWLRNLSTLGIVDLG